MQLLNKVLQPRPPILKSISCPLAQAIMPRDTALASMKERFFLHSIGSATQSKWTKNKTKVFSRQIGEKSEEFWMGEHSRPRKKSRNLWLGVPCLAAALLILTCSEKSPLSKKTVRGPSQSSIKLQLSNLSVALKHSVFCSVYRSTTEIPATIVDLEQPTWP